MTMVMMIARAGWWALRPCQPPTSSRNATFARRGDNAVGHGLGCLPRCCSHHQSEARVRVERQPFHRAGAACGFPIRPQAWAISRSTYPSRSRIRIHGSGTGRRREREKGEWAAMSSRLPRRLHLMRDGEEGGTCIPGLPAAPSQ